MTTSSEAVLQSLRQFRLHEYDWDGSGGLPLRADVADTAIDIYQLPLTTQVPMPEVMLLSDGTVTIEYDEVTGKDVGKKLFLTFKCQDVITYVKLFADGSSMVEGIIRLDGYDPTDSESTPYAVLELTALFDWLAEDD